MILHQQTDLQTGLPDTVVILDPKEPFVQPFGYIDWNEIIVSFRLSATTVSNNNELVSEESTIPFNNLSSSVMYLGLKSPNSILPLEGNTNFIGFSTINKDARTDFLEDDPIGGAYRRYMMAGGVNGPAEDWSFSSILSNNSISVNGLRSGYLHYQLTDGYATKNKCNFVQFRFRVYNKGSANQSIGMRAYRIHPGLWRDGQYSYAVNYVTNQSLKSLEAITSSNLSEEKVFDWNISSLPLNLPNALFLYSPFPTWRLKIHQWSITRLS